MKVINTTIAAATLIIASTLSVASFAQVPSAPGKPTQTTNQAPVDMPNASGSGTSGQSTSEKSRSGNGADVPDKATGSGSVGANDGVVGGAGRVGTGPASPAK